MNTSKGNDRGWVRLYYLGGGMRNVRVTDEMAKSLSDQLKKAADNNWPEDQVISVTGDGDSFSVRAGDIAALVVKPNVSPGRLETFKRWWVDLDGGSRINGIASDEEWSNFEMQALNSAKDGELLTIHAGVYSIYIVSSELLAWRGISDDFGPGLDFDEDDNHHNNHQHGGYQNNHREFRGNRNGGRRNFSRENW